MAQKVTVVFEDDLEGGPAHETVRFVLEGVEYEIDLNKENAAAFRRIFASYIEHARKAGRGSGRRPARAASNRQRSEGIRRWAREAGLQVSERGRIPASVVEQYEAVSGPPPGPPSTPPRPPRVQLPDEHSTAG
jgi:nucleoid-associated protein Lsr2